jgi:hypothetical protein
LLKVDVDFDALPAATGLDVVVMFELVGMDNNKTFYTDSNGMEMQKRILNHRGSYTLVLDKNDKVAANYYPITTAISIEDSGSDTVFTVNTDRAQGGTSHEKGKIEIMQNRRLKGDDQHGLPERLSETDDHDSDES